MPRRYSDISQLPSILPVFPLTGALLLPGGELPLNIFEPRYLAMVDAALAGARLIGMIQSDAERNLLPVGCAGRVTSYNETDDGRYVIALTGIIRFRVVDEFPLQDGFRRIQPDWQEFAADLDPPRLPSLDRAPLLSALDRYFKAQHQQIEWGNLERAPLDKLINLLAMLCPFQPNEQQALLEAPDIAQRYATLCALLELSSPTQTTMVRH